MDKTIVLSLIAGAVGGGCAWFGWKNLKQGDVLANPIPWSRLEQNLGRCVAISGRPESLYDGPDPGRRGRLWLKRSFERKSVQRHEHNAHWHTERTEVEADDFLLHGEGGKRLRVENKPTEVHGTESSTEGSMGVVNIGIAVGPFHQIGGATRVKTEWLAVKPNVTVCGKLVRASDGIALVVDDELGLLLTAHASSKQAFHEKLKGWIGLGLAPALWIFAIVWALHVLRHR